MLESLQGRLIFGRPTRIRPLVPGPHAGGYRVTPHRLERPGGVVLEGWSSTPIDAPATQVMLYFGGRNENVVWAADMASFTRGLAVYAFNYRGFGESTGRASERRAKLDARAIHDFVSGREAMADLVIAGRSLGTAIALWLAHEVRPGRLVLMSPYESVPAVMRARRLAWAAALTTQRFACEGLAAAYAGATLLLLSETDTSIPHPNSLRLAACLPNAPLVQTIVGTTHRSLPRSPGAQAAIAAFLASARA